MCGWQSPPTVHTGLTAAQRTRLRHLARVEILARANPCQTRPEFPQSRGPTSACKFWCRRFWGVLPDPSRQGNSSASKEAPRPSTAHAVLKLPGCILARNRSPWLQPNTASAQSPPARGLQVFQAPTCILTISGTNSADATRYDGH